MPGWFKISATIVGLLFFSFHAILSLIRLRAARSREDRIDGIGTLVPGLGGLLFGAAVAVKPALAAFGIAALGTLLFIFGRAVFELIVFRQQR